MRSYIYKITNTINGQSYIGQTLKTIEERWRGHLSPSSNCVYLKNAIDKYGKDVFVIDILHAIESDNKDDLIKMANTLEMKEIEERCTLAPNGYNITRGGKNGYRKSAPRRSWNLSEETKAKIAKANIGIKRPHFREMARNPKFKYVPVKCLETGEMWESVQACAVHFNVKPKQISRILTGKRKTLKRKYTLVYVNL